MKWPTATILATPKPMPRHRDRVCGACTTKNNTIAAQRVELAALRAQLREGARS